MTNTSLRCVVLACVMVSAATSPLVAQGKSAQGPKSTKSRSLDQQLLDDLDRELLQGLPSGGKPATADPKKSQAAPADQSADNTPPENPLAKIAQRMRSAQSRMARRDTSPQTQQEQDEIVRALDALLAQNDSDQKKSGGKGNAAPQAGQGSGEATPAPPRDSTDRIEHGQTEAVQTTDVKDLMRRIWGHLPDKLRDEMQASLSEQFLPKYERLIEDYYQRLAEQPAGQTGK